MIGIFHYSNSNNIVSLANAIDSITSNFIISDDLNRLLDCEKIILPGIGSMRNLKKSNIINLSKLRGSSVGYKHAEAFEVIRIID